VRMGDRDSLPSERGGEVAWEGGVLEGGGRDDPAPRFPSWADRGSDPVGSTWKEESAWPPDR